MTMTAAKTATTGLAAVVREYGPAGVVGLARDGLRMPARPALDSLRIRVGAASINPLDLAMRQGYGKSIFEGLRSSPFPFIPGLDCVGVVEEVGSHVLDFQAGDRIMAIASPFHHSGRGTWAEIVDLPSALAGLAPCHLSDAEAAAIPYAAMTAAGALSGDIPSRAAILGAAGGVGLFALQILKHHGVHVTAVASGKNRRLCEDHGADDFLDYETKESFSAKVDFVLDCSGGDRSDFSDLSPGGRYLTLSSPLIRTCDEHGGVLIGAPIAAAKLALRKAQAFWQSRIRYEWAFFQPNKKLWEKVVGWSKEGILKPCVSRVFPLEKVVEAQDAFRSDRAPGKIILEIGKK